MNQKDTYQKAIASGAITKETSEQELINRIKQNTAKFAEHTKVEEEKEKLMGVIEACFNYAEHFNIEL